MRNFKGQSFSEIYGHTVNLTKKEKGDLFEEFTYYLLKLDPKLNANLQKIWLYNYIPEKILEELDLPSKDKGIDLLAQINGEYYAIQCKFRQDPNTIIDWTSLSTFFGLSFGINDKIKGGFLVTNTHDLCEEVIKSTKVEPIYGDYFDDLPANFFDTIRKGVTKVVYKKKKPFVHQKACITACEFHYRDFDRAYIEMACGSGKTLSSFWIDQRLANKRTVVFVPSLYLLSQFYSDWINQSYAENKQIKYILVGSDADVDEETNYKSNGLILCTEPKIIRQYIKNCKDKLVVICTYQSANKLAEASKNIQFDMGFFDEAHKTVSQKGKQFTLMLTDEHMDIQHRLFLTATPKMYAGNIEDDNIISMDNKKIYGEKIFTYNTREAIRDGRLVDYQVVSMYARNKDIERTIKKNKLIKVSEELEDIEANYLGIVILLLKKIHDGTCKHLITYHNKIKNAKQFAELLEKVNRMLYESEINIGHLSGSTSMSKRNRIIRDFKNSEVSVLCSARVLNEGVNIPCTDSICFVDTRNSTIDIIQCIGRCLRLSPGKEIAHIIVPTFIDDFDAEFDKDVYGNVIRILKALKNTDEGIVEYFKMKGVGKKRGARQIVVNEFYGEDNFSEEIDLDEWNEKIGEKIWQVVDGFDYMYERVKKFVEDNGRIPSNKSKNESEKKLGSFCSNKRKYYREGLLNKEKSKKLESVNGWYWDHNNVKNSKFIKIKEWIIKHNKIPSENSKNEIERDYGRWCSSRRYEYNKGIIEKNIIEKLEGIKCWYWKKDDIFEETFEKIKKWINVHGSLPSRYSKNNEEQKLGHWCNRQQCNKRKNALTSNRVKKLETLLDWSWGSNKKQEIKTFDEMYNKVKKWVGKHDRIPSGQSNDGKEKQLGVWCCTRRGDYKKNKLNNDKITRLENILHWYWSRDNFDEMYNSLIKFIKENKRLPKSNSQDANEKMLSTWCLNKKADYKNDKLSKERINKLNELLYWNWGSKTKKHIETFDDMYAKVKKWITKHKRLPRRNNNDSEEKTLNAWCCNKRNLKKRGKLTKIQINKLQQISLWSWGTKKIKTLKSFNERYDELVLWMKNNNNILPSQHSSDFVERALGQWCCDKKKQHKKGTLNDTNIKKLEKISGWFWIGNTNDKTNKTNSGSKTSKPKKKLANQEK